MKAQDLDNTSPLSLKDVYFVWPIPLVGIHKKCKRTNPKNYRPIPPFSFKKVVEASDKIPYLFTDQQLTYYSTCSLPGTSSVHVDQGNDTFIKSVANAVAFDGMWHLGLAANPSPSYTRLPET